jgi:hypothetical protein
MPTARRPPAALDPRDLAARWRLARGAAIERALPEGGRRAEEARALELVAPARRAAVSEAFFRNSWWLGRSAAERFGAVQGVEAMAALLAALGEPPCLAPVTWIEEGRRVCHRRRGCSANPDADAFLCDAWREAIDGLVCGLGDGVRFVRRQSRGRGGECCEDLLHPADERDRAWAEPAAEVAGELAAIATGLAERGVVVRFLGLAENRLGYVVEAGGLPDCGPAGGIVQALIENHVHHRLPGVELAAAAPRSVL